MTQSEQNNEKILHLELDDGSLIDCSVIGVFDVEDREYIAMVSETDEALLIYRYHEMDEDEVELSNIETDEEYQMVLDAFWHAFGEEMEEQDHDHEDDREEGDEALPTEP